ncbi:MAG: J domain-containing protein [Polyangiales bacterium]
MEPTASGVLAKTPLAHLLVYCLEKKLRGALVFRPEGDSDPSSADVVTLVDGCPAKVRTAEPIEHLGRILLELGLIDDVAYNESLMAMSRGEGLQGQILRKAGKVDQPSLERGLRTQIARKLGHLFGKPPTTTYAYYDGQDFLARYGGPETYPIDPLPTLWVGIRTAPSEPHVDATLAKVAQQHLRVREGASFTGFDLTRAEQDVLERIKGAPMTSEQVIRTNVSDSRTTRLFIYAMLLCKHLEVIPGSTTRRTGAVSLPGASNAPPTTISVKPAIAAPVVTPNTAARLAKINPLKVPTPVPVQLIESGGGDGRDEPPSSGPGGRRDQIRKKVASINTENYFEILGIAREASEEEAKAAYFRLAKAWHPDRLPTDLADLKGDVGKVFALMAEAYQTLSDKERRVRYLQVLREGGGTPEDQAEVARIMEASNAFQKADFFVGKGSLAEAEPHARRAYEIEPTETDHIAVWVWIQANKPERRDSGKYDDLLMTLGQAITAAPKNERARFYRGMILKAAGRMGDAIRDFKEIMENNPKHVDSVREVRLYQMRQDRDRKTKDEGTSSLLGRFMKKK